MPQLADAIAHRVSRMTNDSLDKHLAGSRLDYVFYLCTPDGMTELGRMKYDSPHVDILHNFLLFTDSANKRGFTCTLLQGWQEFTLSNFKPTASKLDSYHGWRRKIRKLYPEAIFDGNADICQAFAHDDSRIDAGQWDGATGYVCTY